MIQLSASLNFLFRDLPVLDRIDAIARAGFTGVEIQKLEAPVGAIAQRCRDAGLQVALLNVDLGDWFDGGNGLSAVPGRQAEFLSAVDRAVDAADLLNVKHIHLGPSRIPAGSSRAECLRVYRDNVAEVLNRSAFAEGAVTAMLEAMNPIDAPTVLFANVADAVAFINEFFAGQLHLQFDCYHVAKGGFDLLSCWHEFQPWVKHIQFSDTPNRTEPGSGGIDYRAFFAVLQDSAYRGWLGAEYVPSGDPNASLDWMLAFQY